MFHLFGKRTRAASRPVIAVTGKIKYSKETERYSFWPNYAKSNELKAHYDLGHYAKNPCKFHNITCIGIIDMELNEIVNFTNGVDGALLMIEK
jgi:hypothetical protein